MLAPGIWMCLAVGLLQLFTPRGLWEQRVSRLGPWLTFLGILSPWWWPGGDGSAVAGGWWVATAWWLGFGWTARLEEDLRGETCKRQGEMSLAVSGLLLAAEASDWLMLFFAVELVRRATFAGADLARAARIFRSSIPGDGADQSRVAVSRITERDWQLICPLILCLSLVAWVVVAGSNSLVEWRAVLERVGFDDSTGQATGRPSLVLTAASLLTVIGVCCPVFWSWNLTGTLRSTSPFEERLGQLLARELVAIVVLQRLLAGGVAGLTATWLVGLLVMTGTVWCLAGRQLLSQQRFDRGVAGLLLFQWGSLLLWLCAGLATPTESSRTGDLVASLDLGHGFYVGVLHFVGISAGVAAGLRGIALPRDQAWYWEQFRGLGRPHPGKCLMFILPCLSAIGLPGCAGFWLRGLWLLSLLGLNQVGGNSSLQPQFGVWLLTLVGMLLLTLAAGCILRLVQLLWLEAEFGDDRPLQRWWPRLVSWAVTACVLTWGLVPQLTVWPGWTKPASSPSQVSALDELIELESQVVSGE